MYFLTPPLYLIIHGVSRANVYNRLISLIFSEIKVFTPFLFGIDRLSRENLALIKTHKSGFKRCLRLWNCCVQRKQSLCL